MKLKKPNLIRPLIKELRPVIRQEMKKLAPVIKQIAIAAAKAAVKAYVEQEMQKLEKR